MEAKYFIGAVIAVITLIAGWLHNVQNGRLARLEKKIEDINLPNVGEAMCAQKHDTLDKALKYFMAQSEKRDEKLEKHGDTLIKLNANLEQLVREVRAQNGRTDQS